MPSELAVTIDPPDIEEEDLEDFLATDILFVEYFNYFLQLPTFPEPLCFNRDTGGFEVVSTAKKKLANQIKAAVRSSKRTPKIYRVTKKHAFSDLPLIPVVEDEGPGNVEIDTSFTVQTLNKEQGIEWVKKERLPAFLQSDCYLEYRLAKIMSETKLFDDDGERVTLKINHKPRKRKRRKRDITPPPVVDPREQMIENMFVCMGEAHTTETQAWFSEAQLAHEVQVTVSSATRPSSSVLPPSVRPASSGRASSARRPKSGRPSSSLSLGGGDSGLGSSTKGSIFGSSNFNMSNTSMDINSDEDDIYSSKLFAPNQRPVTPRPSEAACVISDTAKSGPVFYTPSIELPSNDSVADGNLATAEVPRVDSQASVTSITFQNIDELGAVIVATAVKQAMATVLGKTPEDIAQLSPIQNIYPSSEYFNFSFDMLDHVSVLENTAPLTHHTDKNITSPVIDTKATQSTTSSSKEQDMKVKDSGYESEDSLLGSDDDYEDRDTFFRKQKFKMFSLQNRKGIEEYKRFLQGTQGEKNWQMWLDIDRGRLLKQDEISWYLSAMRSRYHQQGAPLELPQELKHTLGLTQSSRWQIRKLLSIQGNMAEALVLYWAPRFLLKQRSQKDVEPKQNPLYHHQTLLRPKSGAYPNPPTKSLLPLRPKSCVPRVKESLQEAVRPSDTGTTQLLVQEAQLSSTMPPIGLKRTYNIPNEFIKYIHGCQPDLPAKEERDSNNNTVKKTPRPPVSPRPLSAGVQSTEKWEESSNTSRKSSKPRAKSAVVRRASKASSDSSVFNGGRRMEGLLQALDSEKMAGQFFNMFIDKSRNKLWKNCISFWHDLQDYHNMFYADVLDIFNFDKKAQFINAQYIVEGANNSISCSPIIRVAVNRNITPPFEELFDAAEEYVLSVLYVAWMQMKYTDTQTYEKVELVEVKRHLETKSRYVFQLQRRGLIRQISIQDEVSDDINYADPIYDETLIDKVPEEYQDIKLEKLVHNRLELEEFKQYLSENYASMDLMCWMDIEAFRRIPHEDHKRRDVKAKDIKTKYLNKKYFFGPNSPAGKEGQDKIMASVGGWGELLKDRPASEMLLEVQKYVQQRLDQKWLPMFLATEEFADRQRPQSSMGDVAEDIIMQRKKKSLALMKVLESKWVSSSKEIIGFRKALLNPVTSTQFRKYVTIRGDFLENDVLFWQEVQKYKDLHHVHSDDTFVQTKIATIINCFIDSQIPPSLQLDIPQEMADKILDRRRELGPYLFREAQLTVFKVLFSHWNEFCVYRSKVADDKIMPTLERQRKRAKAKERIRLREVEEQQEKDYSSERRYKHRHKEFARRKALGLPMESSNEHDPIHDPFRSKVIDDEEDDPINDMNNEKISWSYSQYMKAMSREEVLNNTDESTFSSLSDTASEVQSQVGEVESGKSVKLVADVDKPVKKVTHASDVPSVDNKNSRQNKHDHVSSTVEKDTRSSKVHIDPTITKDSETSKQRIMSKERSKINPETAGKTKHRTARGMPPLVQRN